MTRPISKKPVYNLNLVLQETGIKADTLRAWERRYQLPQPHRTGGGHRLFSEYDIETIRWLIERQEEGMRISRAVDLWNNIISNGEDPLNILLADQTAKPAAAVTEHDSENLSIQRSLWVQACLSFNESAAEQVLTQSFAQFSLETVCVEILQAGLTEIGELWYQGKASVQQEHFASELAVRRLHALIAASPQPIRDSTILVSCSPGENHSFPPLLITLLLRYRGWNVIYLGANVPKQQFKETIENTKPDLVVMTAMRLTTAAALLDTVLFIKELDVPVVFGGRVFSIHPEIAKMIPGFFLGEDLLGSIPVIEGLLIDPLSPVEHQAESDRFAATITAFSDKNQVIGSQVLQNLSEKFAGQIPLRFFQEANHYLANDIVAALTLGDLDLLGSNVAWIELLLTHHDLSQDLLFDFLQSYAEAVQSNLGETGRPIFEWLAKIIINKPSTH
jgi:methanogenic corrinoid protein MtbC1